MKKILYVITKSNWGGAQRYVFDLAHAVTGPDLEPSVVLGGSGPLKEKLEKAGIRTIPVKRLQRNVNPFKDLFVFVELLRIFRSEKPDVIHLNSSKIGGIGALAARFAKVPHIIFTAHGWAFNEERPAREKFLIKLASWITVMLCHKTIVLSEKEKYQAFALPFTADKLMLIPNGIAKTRFKLKKNALAFFQDKIGSPIPDDNILIGSIAELHPNKGVRYTIEAISTLVEKHPNLRFIICGEGEERKNLEGLVARHDLQNKVHFVGHVDKAEEYLKAFDIFVLSSIKEGLPYVILEAGLAGIPVVSTNTGGIPEVVEDMRSGILVHSKRSDEIAKALDYLSLNKKKRKEFGKNIKARIETRHAFNDMIEKTIRLYNKKNS